MDLSRQAAVWDRRAAIAALGGCAAASLVGLTVLTHSEADDGDNRPVMRYTYGAGPSQFAELSLPAGSAPAPVVVIVHGGFWRTGFGVDLGRPLAADLIKRGFAAANVEYRRVGSGPAGGGGWPQTGQDVAAAVDALATEGQRLTGGRLDLNRVVGLGHSAGGQLVGWLGARRSPVVKLCGLVSQAGVLDLVHAADAGAGGGAVEDFMGGSPDEKPDAYADASPVALAPLGVPSICVHGRADTVVPIDQSERFVGVARNAGDTSALRDFDGGHFDPTSVGSPAWSLCVAALTDLAA
jgi:acetyl esterase/lipase